MDDGSANLQGNLCIELLVKRGEFSRERTVTSARQELSNDALAEIRRLFGNEFTIQEEDLKHGGSYLFVF